MRLRLTEIDRPLTAVVVALAAYGLATLYSAGQTDVPTFVTTIWQRQVIWLGVGLVAVVLMFRTSPRLLEWATPYAYGISVVVLLLTLATATGAGTAASERSWHNRSRAGAANPTERPISRTPCVAGPAPGC